MFLPSLPLLASQILLNNFLSDIPATCIASDNVDPEWVARSRRRDTGFIRNYMVLFGLVSSLPASLMLAMIGLTLAYLVAAEAAKEYFYAQVARPRAWAAGAAGNSAAPSRRGSDNLGP